MAAVKLVTLDVTNTIIRVLHSVGFHYVKLCSLNSQQLLGPSFELLWRETATPCQQDGRVAKEFGVVLDVPKVDVLHQAALRRMSVSFPMYGCHDGLSMQQWWGRVVTETLSESGVKSKAVLEGMSGRLYSEFCGAGCWEVYADVPPTLTALKERGMTLGVVSNFDERLESILSSVGLTRYLDFIVATYKIKRAKPDPQMFHEALKIASVDAANAMHIGDDYVMDYLTPKAVGMRALWLIRNGSSEEQSREAADANEIADSFQKLLTYTSSSS